MPTLHRSNHLLVQHHHASGYVRVVVRSEAPFESVAEVIAALDACRTVLDRIHAGHHGILSDWRKSPISTNPRLHKALAKHMDALGERFVRQAILLATPIGTMQAARVSRLMGNQTMVVFNDEGLPVEYVTSL